MSPGLKDDDLPVFSVHDSRVAMGNPVDRILFLCPEAEFCFVCVYCIPSLPRTLDSLEH